MNIEAKIKECDDKVVALKEEIKSTYEAIGKAYFEKYVDSDEATGVFAEGIEKIKAAFTECGIQNQIKLAVQGKRICEACGNVLTVDSLFCNKCGNKLEELPAAVSAAVEEANAPEAPAPVAPPVAPPPVAPAPSPVPVAPAAPAAKHCGNCGRLLKPGAMFCPECGAHQ